MKVLKITNQPDGSAILDLEISEEENKLLIQYAVVNILKEQIENEELIIKKHLSNHPIPPLNRLIKEGDTRKKCLKCGSSTTWKFWPFIKSKYCIQPKCENYYRKEKLNE